ncbi:MAG: amidohydrolase family protein [Thermodesulfobacteriota bacterium]
MIKSKVMKKILLLTLFFLFAAPVLYPSAIRQAHGSGQAPADVPFDVVILNGRVMDPETSFDEDGVNVGIRGGEIIKVTKEKIRGSIEIDATGKVVAPGFIDVLSYDPNERGAWYKVADGVTTNLAMHGGTAYPRQWYKRISAIRPPINFGAAFFYLEARNSLGIWMRRAATEREIEKLSAMAAQALNEGALGIGISLEYAPGISSAEVEAMMRIAKRFEAPVFFHVRYSDMEPPGTNIDALNEVISLAEKTGASVHVDHITSTGGTFSMKESLKMIEAARGRVVDITACVYPYDFWGTYLNSARFDDGWQKRFRITYEDLQIAGTGERLTEESFKKYRKLGKLAVAYAIPEEDVIDALRSSFVMIGSDAILTTGNNHPRATGAFSRTLGVYVRERGVLSLMEAIKKMTLLPAERLEKRAPLFKKKGRLREGMDADIVVFDPAKIKDTSTVEKPASFSIGIDYVLIDGKIVKTPEGLKKNIRPGKALKALKTALK